MTPERAAELAGIYTNNYCSALAISPHVNLSEYVQQAILAACNDQKEADAKICEGIAAPMYPHAQGPYLDCAKAIRSAE